ncbi:MAG: hypothetical protein AAGB51_11735 [Planctomycetota bacterium]
MNPDAGLAPADWLVLAGYGLTVLTLGWWAGRGATTRKSLFVGGGAMPVWAIAVSVVATSASGATFIGGPQASYDGNLTYLSASVASVLGAVLVAILLLPRILQGGATTVYECIGRAHGPLAQKACAVAFLAGRVLASGSRLYIAALPCSLVVFGETAAWQVAVSAVVLGICATAYAAYGGIRAVIWTDTLQAVVVVAAVAIAIGLLWSELGPDTARAGELLTESGKLRFIDARLDLSAPFGIWTILLGLTLFNAAAFGTDQDLAQRLLTTDSPKRAAWSLIASSLLGIGLVGLFLVVGLLLYLRDTTQAEAASGDTRDVFLVFILSDLPVGVRGLLVAGLFAAAMSSTDSALNGMSSSLVIDLHLLGGAKGDARGVRLMNAACGLLLTACAVAFAVAEAGSAEGLIPFALGVMVYAYAGLLGVFISTLLFRRGSAASVCAALLTGAAVVAGLQFVPESPPAFGWRMLLGTAASTAVCLLAWSRDRH